MQKLQTSTQYVSIPVSGPVADPTIFPVGIALLLESVGGEPTDSEYHTATWINGEAVLLLTPEMYPAGAYLAFVRLQAAPEDVRLFSGRVRIGDART